MLCAEAPCCPFLCRWFIIMMLKSTEGQFGTLGGSAFGFISVVTIRTRCYALSYTFILLVLFVVFVLPKFGRRLPSAILSEYFLTLNRGEVCLIIFTLSFAMHERWSRNCRLFLPAYAGQYMTPAGRGESERSVPVT